VRARLARCTAAAIALLLTGSADVRPEGWSNRSYYVAMPDGTRIALSLWFPGGKPPSSPTPVVLVQTRYGRAGMIRYGKPWVEAGYVVAAVDTRGSTASFGPRDGEITADEIRDMDALIAHLARQPWSNGQVIAAGVSYMADTADIATSRPAPALKAAIVREVDFDAYLHLFAPGGVENSYMLNAWGGATRELDLGRDGRGGPLDCRARVEDCPKLYPQLQPVDDDRDFAQLRSALNGRRRWGPEDYVEAEYRDDPGRNGHRLFDLSPAAQLAGIRRQAKPAQIWGSWMDAGTAEAALARFRSAPGVPMELWITANDHNHRTFADPFFPDRTDPVPSIDAQFEANRAFADRARAGQRPKRLIHYYVLGTGAMRTTASWPPAGAVTTRLMLGAGGRLAAKPQVAGVDTHRVDFAATTGKQTRWSTNFGTSPRYPDRRAEDRRLAVYDGAPMTRDMELAGTPVLSVELASDSRDPALFAYLEDVAPDGRVTYLTEGQLRLIHRKPADPKSLPYDQGPAPHSFRRADALPVVPSQTMTVRFALSPVAAKIARGHRIRLALGGHDADTFKRYPATGEVTFRIARGGRDPSRIELPMRVWKD